MLSLQYLKQSVVTVLDYPTHVDVCVVTDNEAALARVFIDWDLGGSLWVCNTDKDADDPNEYALLFEHRQVMKQAYRGGSSTISVKIVICKMRHVLSNRCASDAKPCCMAAR